MAAATDTDRVLCYHAMLAAAHTAGSTPRARADREWALAPGMAKLVVFARGTADFIAALAAAKDVVTQRPLVTEFMVSADHGVCCLLQDVLVAWLNARDCSVSAAWEAAGAVLANAHVAVDFVPAAGVSVRDVFGLGLPLVGAFTLGGAVPVCTDLHAVQFLKKVTLLLYIVQYSPVLCETVRTAEAFVENSVRAGTAPGSWWEGVCAMVCPMLWSCFKLDIAVLLEMCANIQMDGAAWRASVLEAAYSATSAERLLGDAIPESVETEYAVASLTEYVAKTYRGQKLMNPTAAQRHPYALLLVTKMRLARHRRNPGAREDAFPGWTADSQVVPHILAEVADRFAGRGIIVQDASKRHSFALGANADGSGFIACGTDGQVAEWGAGHPESADAQVAACTNVRFWRAYAVEHTPDGTHADRGAFLRALLAADGLRIAWVKPPPANPAM